MLHRQTEMSAFAASNMLAIDVRDMLIDLVQSRVQQLVENEGIFFPFFFQFVFLISSWQSLYTLNAHNVRKSTSAFETGAGRKNRCYKVNVCFENHWHTPRWMNRVVPRVHYIPSRFL